MKKKVVCPFCKKNISLGIEIGTLNTLQPTIYFPHIHIHGTPLHALICYISSNLQIRNLSVIKSIEISRDSETFSQCMKKWTNPY
ncbi:MAG: hypothetical protein ACFE9I_01385 [Candidatus Hermodarchaeota archaeon]